MPNIKIPLPIYSTILGMETITAPSPLNANLKSLPTLYVGEIPEDATVEIESQNKEDGSWELCKFKNGSDMILDSNSTRQIVFEPAEMLIRANLIIDSTVSKNITDLTVGEAVGGKVFMFNTTLKMYPPFSFPSDREDALILYPELDAYNLISRAISVKAWELSFGLVSEIYSERRTIIYDSDRGWFMSSLVIPNQLVVGQLNIESNSSLFLTTNIVSSQSIIVKVRF